VLLEFTSGKQRFRVARRTKWTGRSSVTDIRLEEWQGAKWVSLADRVGDAESWIEKIVGLDFNGFTKSVVLPQGQFDLFLKGKPDERRRILSELLLLDVYQRMMKRANEIASEHNKEADIRENMLKGEYARATPESLASLKDSLESLTPQREPLAHQLDLIRKALPEALQLLHSRTQLTNAESELSKVGPDQSKLEKQSTEMKERIEKAQKSIAAADRDIQRSPYNAELRDELVSRRHQAQLHQETSARLAELAKLRTAKSKDLAKLVNAVKTSEEARATLAKELKSIQNQLTTVKKELEASRKKYGTPADISSLIKTNQDRIKAEQKKVKLEAESKRLAQDQQKHEARQAEVKTELTAAEESLTRARLEMDRLRQMHAAEELQHTLKVGQPCPVCETEVKRVPKTRKHPSLDQAQRAIDAAEKLVKSLLAEDSDTKGQLRQLRPQLDRIRNDIDEHQSLIDEAAALIRGTLRKTPIETAADELEKLYKSAIDLEKEVDLTTTKLESAREREAAAKDSSGSLNSGRAKLEAEVSGIVEEEQRLATDNEKRKTELGKYSDLSLVESELKKQDEARLAREKLTRTRETEVEELSKVRNELNTVSVRLDNLRSRAEQLESSRKTLKTDIDQKRKGLRTAVPQLKLDQADADPSVQLEALRKAAQTKLDSLATEILRLEQQITLVESQIKRASEMRADLESHRRQGNIAREVGLLLRGDQFIAFIQQEAYRRLAADGSLHLNTLSSGRYSFGHEKDEFVVIDHWNADEARPVATLSGGESFLASLSLALALAEGLSGLSHRGRFVLESLFLDEGFGTLDPETLDVVLQGIETLSTGDRLVGIVSHIPELADRMPSRIIVRKAVGGSTIEWG
jgi:exonuclease SbcC